MQEKVDFLQIILLCICILAIFFIMCFYPIFVNYKSDGNKEFVKWYFSIFIAIAITLGLLEILQILLT